MPIFYTVFNLHVIKLFKKDGFNKKLYYLVDFVEKYFFL